MRYYTHRLIPEPKRLGIYLYVLPSLPVDHANVTDSTVPMVLWFSTELLVTIPCVSIPVLRPLYLRIIHGSNVGGSNQSRSYQLPEYAGKNQQAKDRSRGERNSTIYLGAGGSVFKATVNHSQSANTSEESILRHVHKQGNGVGQIKRTDEVSVSYMDNGPSNMA